MRRADQREHLLVVDDDVTFGCVLGRALQRRGFSVEVATGFHDALARAAVTKPGFAVLDLGLPDASGLALIPALKRVAADVRIVVLTGYASIATAVEAIKLGAVHYLAKPADADDVVASLLRGAGNPDIEVNRRPPSVNRLEWEHIQRVLRDHGDNVSATARALGMHRRTLQRKLAKRPVRH
jgi:two-component system response regulator RegA